MKHQYPVYGGEKGSLSLALVNALVAGAKSFCLHKNLSTDIIPELLDPLALGRLVKYLGLKVKVDELVEEPVTVAVAKETPLGIELALGQI